MESSKEVVGDNSPAPFRLFAERYTLLGVSVIPCKGPNGKIPAVKWGEYQKRLPTETELAQWVKLFPGANIGIVTGGLSGLTVIDSDNPELKLSELFTLFGETPLVAFTPRGGYHLYYRYNGERNTPPKNIIKVDVRGEGGFIIAPPSRNPQSRRSYSFVEGDISDIEGLPFIKTDTLETSTLDLTMYKEGERNRALFSYLVAKAQECDSTDNLGLIAHEFNATRLMPPLSEEEVSNTIKSVWSYKKRGKLFTKGQQSISYPIDRLRQLMFEHPRSMVLYADLIACHKGVRSQFAIVLEGYAQRSGWDVKTIRQEIKLLVQFSLIRIAHKGGSCPGDATLYEFTERGKISPLYNLT